MVQGLGGRHRASEVGFRGFCFGIKQLRDHYVQLGEVTSGYCLRRRCVVKNYR